MPYLTIKEKNQISDIQIKSTTRVKLDVGGHIFHTSISTLTNHPESMLGNPQT
jgi:hypothetical protein